MMDYQGLKAAIIEMLSGADIRINIATFKNDIVSMKTKDRNDYPALVVELKWNKSAKSALQQIKDRKYPASIEQYTGDILLVGINYDKKTKKHECVIEQYEK